VDILDPDATAMVTLLCDKLDSRLLKEKSPLRSLADEVVAGVGGLLKEYRVRPDSWKEREVSGRPALVCLADYVQDNCRMVEYRTYVLGKSTWAVFVVNVEPGQLEAFRLKFAPIIDTFSLK